MAASESLKALATTYRQQAAPACITTLRALSNDYSTAQIAAFLDVAALGLAFDVVFSEPAFDASQVTPDMARAWSAAYPKVSIESLDGLQRESFAGVIGGWKGRLFLVEAASLLNHGSWVGSLHLETGQRAEIPDLDSAQTRRLQIVGENAEGVTPIQRSALRTLGEFLQSLERYSDVPLFATYKIAAGSASGPDCPDAPLDTSVERVHIARLASAAVARILATCPAGIRTGRVFFATPKLDDFLRSLSWVMAGADSEEGAALIRNMHVPDLNRLRATASSFADLVRALETCYPCPERQKKERQPTTAGDFAEALSLVDGSTRLAMLCGSMPLDRWIESMAVLDTSAMSESELATHLADLQQIRAHGLVDKAFSTEGFRERWASAMTGGRKQLAAKLENAIEAGELEMKKFSSAFTPLDAERIMLLRNARSDTLVEVQNEHQHKLYRFTVRPRSGLISASNESQGFRERNVSRQTGGHEDARVLAFATLDDSARTVPNLER